MSVACTGCRMSMHRISLTLVYFMEFLASLNADTICSSEQSSSNGWSKKWDGFWGWFWISGKALNLNPSEETQKSDFKWILAGVPLASASVKYLGFMDSIQAATENADLTAAVKNCYFDTVHSSQVYINNIFRESWLLSNTFWKLFIPIKNVFEKIEHLLRR